MLADERPALSAAGSRAEAGGSRCAVRLVYRCFYRDKLPEYSLSIRNAGIRDFHAFPVNSLRVIGHGRGLESHAIKPTPRLETAIIATVHLTRIVNL